MAAVATGPQFYTHGDPTAEEQELLEDFNRVRADPACEGHFLAGWLRNTPTGQAIVAQYGTNPDQIASDLAAYSPLPPVAMNAQLLQAARAYSRDIASHNGVYPPSGPHHGYDGSTPESRVEAAGYTGGIGSGRIAGGFSGEVAGPGQEDTLANYAAYLIDWGNPGFGHRRIILAAQREAGVGNARKPASFHSPWPLVNTTDFGLDGYDLVPAGHDQVLVAVAPALLVGVASFDANGNGRYEAGEGIAGVRVSVEDGRYYTFTGASGGYALPLVKSSGENFQGAATVHLRDLPGEGTERVQLVRLGQATDVVNHVSYLTNVQLDALASRAATVPALAAITAGDGTEVSRASGGRSVVVRVRRLDVDLSRPLHLRVQAGGSAVMGVDYAPLPGRVTIPAGTRQARLVVRPLASGTDPQATVTLALKLSRTCGEALIRITP